MIHATSAALNKLEPLLVQLRLVTELKEKSRGIFYNRSRAFLHFHEDVKGLFADVSINSSWSRFAVNSQSDFEELLRVVKTEIGTRGNVQPSTQKPGSKIIAAIIET